MWKFMTSLLTGSFSMRCRRVETARCLNAGCFKENLLSSRLDKNLSHVLENFQSKEERTCLDDRVSRRVWTWECTETACGAKRTSCCVKRTLLKDL